MYHFAHQSCWHRNIKTIERLNMANKFEKVEGRRSIVDKSYCNTCIHAHKIKIHLALKTSANGYPTAKAGGLTQCLTILTKKQASFGSTANICDVTSICVIGGWNTEVEWWTLLEKDRGNRKIDYISNHLLTTCEGKMIKIFLPQNKDPKSKWSLRIINACSEVGTWSWTDIVQLITY